MERQDAYFPPPEVVSTGGDPEVRSTARICQLLGLDDHSGQRRRCQDWSPRHVVERGSSYCETRARSFGGQSSRDSNPPRAMPQRKARRWPICRSPGARRLLPLPLYPCETTSCWRSLDPAWSGSQSRKSVTPCERFSIVPTPSPGHFVARLHSGPRCGHFLDGSRFRARTTHRMHRPTSPRPGTTWAS